MYLQTGQPTGSATLKQGRFELKGTTQYPHSATLVLERQGRLQAGWREMMLGGKMRKVHIESPDRLPWVQVSDLHGFESAVAQQYGVKSIPQNFLVDPSGKIVASNLHGEELEATLAKFIK